MTVPSQTPKVTHTANGTTKSFAFTFRVRKTSHLSVYVDSTLKTLGTHYTVTSTNLAAGGTVVFVTAPANGAKVRIYRNMPYSRTDFDYQTSGTFPAATINEDLDALALQVQQIAESVNRSVTVGLFSDGVSTSLPSPSALKFLRWNSAGNALENADASVGAVLASAVHKAEQQTAAEGQTVFNLTNSYLPGTNSLQVEMNNAILASGIDYTETSATSITLVDPAYADDFLVFKTISFVNSPASSAASVSFQQAGANATARTSEAKLRETVSAEDFNFAASTDYGRIAAALASGAKIVELTNQTYSINASLVVPPNVRLRAKGINATTITVTADVVGVVLSGYSALSDVKIVTSGTHTTDLVQVGTTMLDGGRAIVECVWTNGAGRDGIQIRNGNLGTLRDIVSTSNGRDGINFTTETIDNNAWKLEGFIDVRGNARDGVHIASGSSQSDVYASKCHSADVIVSQQNGRYGVYSGTRSNILKVYGEANTTKDLFLDTYAYGNQIELVECQTYADNGTANVLIHHNADADYKRAYKGKIQFQGGAGKGLRIDQSDGNPGRLDIEKTGTRAYSVKCGGSSADQTTTFTHEDDPTYTHNVAATGNFVAASGKGVDFSAAGGSVLNQYKQGSWTPTLKFGSTSTGIAYATRTGTYTRVGNLVTITFEITLSNKGSATGEASITGVPVAAGSLHAFSVYLYSGFSSTYKDGIAYLNASSINEIAANGTAAFTDAQFTNTSRLFGTCTYQV